MNKEDARKAAETQKLLKGVSPTAKFGSIEQMWIELPVGDAEKPGPVRDVLAWLVRYVTDEGWTELAVNDSDGLVVRVTHSR